MTPEVEQAVLLSTDKDRHRTDVSRPELTVREAVRRGARTLVVGVVNAGGVLSETWLGTLVEANGRPGRGVGAR